MRPFAFESPTLQYRPWPCVPKFNGFSPELSEFLKLSRSGQKQRLDRLQLNREAHCEFVNQSLACIYAYRVGYVDSPCYLGANDNLEIQLEQAKIILERELLDFLGVSAGWDVSSQQDLVLCLQQFVANNRGVEHPLFDFLEREAEVESFYTFLLNEVIRNEIVDDEVAWLVAGQQGLMKEATSINLYDECGRGKQCHFHTYWLRILLDSLDGWDDLLNYRSGPRPWYAGITSNVFAMLLTRSPFKWAAYGHFLITESWVAPHFERIQRGMERVGLKRGDNDIYFSAHVLLDPTHTEELILGLSHQVPELTAGECSQIHWGAHLAVAGAVAQYDRMLEKMKQPASAS